MDFYIYIGNIIWIIFGGLFGEIGWIILGLTSCITIIGIPFEKWCFKIKNL
ncbi:YccF domain-containing protein [Clostridium algidicarnis]|uniref:YccF domain-containing protein n=1 Tax=Clostridium algidicarnis TaxID=37659 RepID=UPI001FA799AA|nr:YccF domain-containing protein [Clostridium algidicarnis]